MKNVALIGLASLLAVACSPIKKSLVEKTEQPVFEIAIRAVNNGQFDEFKSRRADFISWLKVQDGVKADREFESFYALPKPDEQQIFIGMTEYQSFKVPGKIQSKMGAIKRFPKFAKTMEIQSYLFVQPIEGPTFNLKTLASKPGEVLEIGVRKVKPGMEKEFNEYRKQFIELLSSYKGVKESYELKVVGGKNIEGLTVGMTVYESKEAFMALAGPIMEQEITQKYFSTFDIVASKFAFTTSNQ